jgi:hypothetical protein
MHFESFHFTLVCWFACAFAAGMVGSAKEATGPSVMLGLLFGPLGIVIALGLDFRRFCPRCHGRLNRHPKMCPHCHMELKYSAYGDAMAPEEQKAASEKSLTES